MSYLFCQSRISCVIAFLSFHLQPTGPSFIKRHGSVCNPASNGVSTKLILSNPRRVNPLAYSKRARGKGCRLKLMLDSSMLYALKEHPASSSPLPHQPSLSPELWTQSLLIVISTANGASQHKWAFATGFRYSPAPFLFIPLPSSHNPCSIHFPHLNIWTNRLNAYIFCFRFWFVCILTVLAGLDV